MQPIDKSYLVEINLGALGVQKNIFFPFQPKLAGKMIYQIEMFNIGDLTLSPNGAAMISVLGTSGVTVTFSVDDQQDLYLFPGSDLNPVHNYGDIREFFPKRINLPKSFVTIQDITNLVANTAIVFNFIYH